MTYPQKMLADAKIVLKGAPPKPAVEAKKPAGKAAPKKAAAAKPAKKK